MNDSAPPKLKLIDVSKSFGDNQVLEGINLEVKEGESLVLFGTSGTGKTLLLKLILGVLHPDSGRIEVDGEDTVGLSDRAHMAYMDRFSMLFQQGGLFDSLKVWENVAFKLMNYRHWDSKKARELAIEKLADVGLTRDVGELYPAEISGGMQKRVGIARAIASSPEIVFLDEPTAGLDPIMSNRINELIVHLVNEAGSTAVSITSDMVSARRISSRMAMLNGGGIIWSGETSELDSNDNPYVRQFVNKMAEGPIKMPVRDLSAAAPLES